MLEGRTGPFQVKEAQIVACPSVVIVFALEPDRQDGDMLRIVDFKQSQITRGAKRNQQLPDKGTQCASRGFATSEGRMRQEGKTLFNGVS